LNPRRIAFLDRDGVINVDNGYVHKWEDIVFVEGVTTALCKLQSMGFTLIIVTNQSGIGRGLYAEEDFINLMEQVVKYFKKVGVVISQYYYCPHHLSSKNPKYAISCTCRKPNDGMINQALVDFNGDRKNSILIGDRDTDILAGQKAELAHSFLLSTGTTWMRLISQIDEIFRNQERCV